MQVKDCTGGFNLINADLLRKVPLDIMDSSGYAFIMELKYLLRKAGGVFKEVPITFTNRVGGESKITNHIVREGVIAPWKMVLSPYGQIIKYIISGGTAAAVDIAFLVLFTEVFKWWYIVSAIVAFIIAFGVSFTLQKFWTFRDHGTERIHVQASIYLAVSIANLGINTLLMYLFVDIFGIWYVASQVLAGGLIAIMSFFVYKKFIFKK
jgi:putative flippase GtrA